MKRLSVFIFVALFAVYLHNLAPGWGAMSQFNTWDGLEYVNCAALLGIDHPPGHPFYILLGKFFTLLPFGDAAWNLNLMSALFGALAVTILFLAICEVLRLFHGGWETIVIALSVSLTFAFSYVFWSHCEIPELHTLFLALIALCLFAAVKWYVTGKSAWLNATALALALGIGVNILGTGAVFIPVALFGFVTVRLRRPRVSWGVPLAIFLSGFLLYLYYPIRLARWPVFSHPMNYLSPYDIGSVGWYAWYISGRSWTGGQMFFMHRVVTNIPLYLKFVVGGLSPWMPGLPLFFFSVAGIVLAFGRFKPLLKALLSRNRQAASRLLLLPFLLVLFAFLLLPEISIHDPSNPRATDYLMNFFLPSLLPLAFFGAYGALRTAMFLKRVYRVAYSVLLAVLVAMPVYQYVCNFGPCNLRDKNSAYVLSRRTMEQIPAGSVIVSKLVYKLVTTYFSEVEKVIPPDKVTIMDPEVVARRLAREDLGKDLFARKNRFMLAEIAEYLTNGTPVFLAGDIVDEDKSPEKLLLSDLDFGLWEPWLPPAELGLSFPRELFLYGIDGLRTATPVKALPEGSERGIANNGRFANGIVLMGFRPAQPEHRIRRGVLSFTFFWTSTKEITGDIYIGLIILDSVMNRIGEPCWHTLGGARGVGAWPAGEIVQEDVNLFPPPIRPGRYFLAVGMADARGDEVKYRAADYGQTRKDFDYVLLAPIGIGSPNMR